MAIVTLAVNLAHISTPRAAIIPYVIIDGNIFFLLGRDHRSGDITDLGGGVKKYESTLTAAFREFNEESDEILGEYFRPNKHWRSVALLDDQMGVLFVPLAPEWITKAGSMFEHKKGVSQKKKSHSEIEELRWFDEKVFIDLFNSQSCEEKMWSRIRPFYRRGYKKPLQKSLRTAYPFE